MNDGVCTTCGADLDETGICMDGCPADTAEPGEDTENADMGEEEEVV